jgi:hypothetical protein
MPPEMIIRVAPTAMMAMVLVSVAICSRVWALRKLLTDSPVIGSTCDPDTAVSTPARMTRTTARPNDWARTSDLAVLRRLIEAAPRLLGHAEGEDGP